MDKKLRIGVCFFILMVLSTMTATASGKSTFVVLPFSVQGSQEFANFERSIPQMLTSRLYTTGVTEPAVADLPSSQGPVSNAADAKKIQTKYNAGYVIWGSVTIMGQECSLDVQVHAKNGKTWYYSSEAKVNQSMTAIKSVSDKINKEVFQKKTSQQQHDLGSAKAAGYRMNPGQTATEASTQEAYLNPLFRYAGTSNFDEASLRSGRLKFTSVGMEICDADGDGQNEIFLLTETCLYAYRFTAGKLLDKPISQYDLPKTHRALSIRSIKAGSGRMQLIVNSCDKDNKPKASIFTFNGSSFSQEMTNIPYFLNVVKLPPSYQPTLIGQQSQPPRLFRPGIYEMNKNGSNLVPGRRLDLPEAANALNFTYLPGAADETGSDKLIVLTPEEHLRVYNLKGSRLAQTEETYSGASQGIEVPNMMKGLSDDKVTMKDVYYIPIRMLATDFEHDGKYELLVNRPMSTASKIFDRYRFFPQSEIHNLIWDGIGLNFLWKSPRIKGSIVDFTVVDANNDGALDLAICLNTHPGPTGVNKRDTMVVLYPLDLEQTSPHARISYSTD